jgi:hypothetical protein
MPNEFASTGDVCHAILRNVVDNDEDVRLA